MNSNAASRAAMLEQLRQKRQRGEKNKYEGDPDDSPIEDEVVDEDNAEEPEQKRSKTDAIPMKKLSDFAGFTINDESVEKKNEQVPITPKSISNPDTKPFKFYCLDAYEDVVKKPGDVFLFGKTLGDKPNEYVSCCVRLQGIRRRLFILPRQFRIDKATGKESTHLVTSDEVAGELKHLQVKSFNLSKKEKKYCLTAPGVPQKAEYLELRYSFKERQLPVDTTGATFSHVFGTTSNGLEIFLLECRVRLPCWIVFKKAVINKAPFSWCATEAVVENPVQVDVEILSDPPPPLSLLSVSIRAIPLKNGQKEIVAIGMVMHDSYNWDKSKQDDKRWRSLCVVKKGAEQAYLFDFKQKLAKEQSLVVLVQENERALLSLFLAKMQQHNPDIIVGHDLWDYELQTLISRVCDKNLPQPHRLGRLRRGTALHRATTKFDVYETMAGRLICDLKVMAMEFVLRAKSYDLTELANHLLNERRVTVSDDTVTGIYNTSEALIEFMKMTTFDAGLCCRLMAKLGCLALTSEITKIVGGIWSKTLAGGRSERTEFLLLHAFEAAGYIAPEKQKTKKVWHKEAEEADFEDDHDTARKKNSYVGGLVLEPKKGLYDNYVLLLDFNSLYPSIIMEYNVCFTTIDQRNFSDDGVIPDVPQSGLEPGILPNVVRNLVQRRKEVKKLMKADIPAERYQELNIRQQALKLTANSMYGCLGFSSSRFYAKPLASLITSQGREILMDTKNLVENRMRVQVVYGDTDSVMINTNSDKFEDAISLGKKITFEVNKKYRQLELDIDGVYKKLLLYKKKKYAGLLVDMTSAAQGNVNVTREMKGLEIVRRDCPLVAVEAGSRILDELLSDVETSKALENVFSYLTDLGQNMRNGNIPVDRYEIFKQLNRTPDEYADKKQPHVLVALRLNANGRHYKQGDVIGYIICENGTNEPATQRAYHWSEMESHSSLKIDITYYLSQQVHPIVTRLLEPTKRVDAYKVAECLGLNLAGYRRPVPPSFLSKDRAALETFAGCMPFIFKCPYCEVDNEVAFPFVQNASEFVPSLQQCTNEACSKALAEHKAVLINQLNLNIRNFIKKHYEDMLACDDETCGYRARIAVVKTRRNGKAVCPNCRQLSLYQEYSSHNLYSQLMYYRYILDWNTVMSKLPGGKNKEAAYDRNVKSMYMELKRIVDLSIERNAYSYIDLGKLFAIFK